MNFLGFVLRRAARHWQMLLTLGLGVLIATALLASSPVLVNTVVEFGLRRAMLSGDPLAGNLQLRGFDRTDAADFAATNAQVQTAVIGRLGPHLDQIVPSVGARWLFPWVDGIVQGEERVNPRFYGSDEELRGRSELVTGVWPEEMAPDAATNVVAVIGEELAEAYGLEPGDVLPLSLTRDEEEPSYGLQVSGIIRARDPRDPFWMGEFSPLRAQTDERFAAQYAALVPEASFFDMAAALFPDMPAELNWNVLLDPATFITGDIEPVQAQLQLLAEDLRGGSPPVTIDTRLNDVLASFASQSTAVRAPLYFLTAEVVLLALYYVVMVSSLSVRQVEREFAVLQSRGGSGQQIFRLQAAEAGLVALVAFVAGPLLGTALVRGLTTFGPLADVSEPGWPLTLPQLAWVAAAVGAVACLAALLLPVGPAINRSIVSYQQEAARSTKKPLWQRAYLDVIILVIGLVLLWRLQLYGGIVGGGSGQQVDWLLLLSPVALLIGAGTILLRIFPIVLNGLANLAGRGRGLPASLALSQAARNPTHVARLVLLLTLAIALGILTTGINATLDASEEERSLYTAGSDVRLISSRGLSASDIAGVEGTAGTSTVLRTEGSLSIGRSYLQFDALGIDPATFAPLTTYRDDFAAQPMDELLAELVLDVPVTDSTAVLPGQPSELSFRVWSEPDGEDTSQFSMPFGESDLDRFGLRVKLISALGEAISVSLEPNGAADGYPADGWRRFSSGLPALSAESYPLVIDSVAMTNRTRSAGRFTRRMSNEMSLAIDEITVTDAPTGEQLVATDIERELATLNPEATAMAAFSAVETRDGEGSLALAIGFNPSDGLVLRSAPLDLSLYQPLPALVSPLFLAATDTSVGETINVSINSRPVSVYLAEQVNYFPTLYNDQNAGFMVTNRDALLGLLNALSGPAVNVNEALLAAEEGVAVETLSTTAAGSVSGLSQVLEADAIRRTIKADPMGLGLRSVTLFGYVMTAMLALIGFATYFYFSARQRESMYGVLRSIGMSPGQLYGVLVLEQVVLIIAGVTIGTFLGLLLNRITLPGLPITFGDRPPTPPFIAQNDWAAVGRIYLTLGVAFLLSLGAATLLLWRTNLHRALRVGEE